jgi:GT2 family glycosyltransferase
VSGDGAPVVITVVTPTHGRAELIQRLLASLSTARSRVDDPVEVVLVDSTPGEEASTIAALAAQHGAEFLPAHNDVRHKRNLGIEHARGEIVLFVDSDCEADPDLLVEHAAAHRVPRAPDGRPVGGVLGLVHPSGPTSLAWRAAEAAGFCDGFDFAARYPQAEWGPCANISYRRDVLGDVGGFRENWPRRLGGDDVELGLRVNAAGRAIVCRPTAAVRHSRTTWSSWRALLERAWRWGAMDIHVRATVHPDRRRPAGAGPEFILFAGTTVALSRAIRHRSIHPLRGVPIAAAAALACELGRRPPLARTLAGAVLRLVFASAAITEALRQGRPKLAFVALSPVDRDAARRRARRRTATTIAALLALTGQPNLPGAHRLSGRRRNTAT